MAIWQFPFYVVPDSWVQHQSNEIENFLTDDGWELPNVWKHENRQLEFLIEFDQFLNRGDSWSQELALWKSPLHDSDIYAWHKNGAIEELQVRMDLRGDVRSMALNIVEFSAKRELSFFILYEGSICPPNIFCLVDKALGSRAAKYANITHI